MDHFAESPQQATPEGLAQRPSANCSFGGGCGEVPPPALPADVAALVRHHPCYSEAAHHQLARMHLAVAPACNVQCNYCNRKYDCAAESRPGVTSRLLDPEAAVRQVLSVAARLPSLAVVGIAGPGDPLANPDATFATLEGVRRVAPDLILCLSTNGLALPDHVAHLTDLGVRHVTVTVNMTDPEVGERMYPWIIWKGRRVRGREASRILSERQLEGVARLAEQGILCKVNAVVIPGVNDAHLPAVVRVVRGLGAFLVNLVPLLTAPEYGTAFARSGQRGPNPAELETVQDACALDARLMRHCRQCRADAVGQLGDDCSAELASSRVEVARDLPDARILRSQHRAAVAVGWERAAVAREEALRELTLSPDARPARVAVASRGRGLVDQHFGHAREFLVYEVERKGSRLVGVRRVGSYCQGGEGKDDALEATLHALKDCQAVLVARIGRCPAGQLEAAGVIPVTAHAFQPIETAVLAWYGERVATGRAA